MFDINSINPHLVKILLAADEMTDERLQDQAWLENHFLTKLIPALDDFYVSAPDNKLTPEEEEIFGGVLLTALTLAASIGVMQRKIRISSAFKELFGV